MNFIEFFTYRLPLELHSQRTKPTSSDQPCTQLCRNVCCLIRKGLFCLQIVCTMPITEVDRLTPTALLDVFTRFAFLALVKGLQTLILVYLNTVKMRIWSGFYYFFDRPSRMSLVEATRPHGQWSPLRGRRKRLGTVTLKLRFVYHCMRC